MARVGPSAPLRFGAAEPVLRRSRGNRAGERKLAEILGAHADPGATTGRLAASIAHEVNNSLETMQNCLHLLSGQVRPRAVPAYGLLRTEAARLARLVEEVLGLYRNPQSGARTADLNAVLGETLHALQPRLRRAKLRVTAALGRVPRAAVTPAQLRMVVSNLIVNAADAMPGGSLRVETRALAGNRVRLRVADTGVGIPPQLKPRIFQPFVTSKGDRGTGLGLWIVAQIVSHHGGQVRALTRRGGGTVMEVELPAVKNFKIKNAK